MGLGRVINRGNNDPFEDDAGSFKYGSHVGGKNLIKRNYLYDDNESEGSYIMAKKGQGKGIKRNYNDDSD